MRTLLILTILADFFCCGWIVFQAPIIKRSTQAAISSIEAHYLRKDLSSEERELYVFDRNTILENERATSAYREKAIIGAFILGGLLLVQNAVLLWALPKSPASAPGQEVK